MNQRAFLIAVAIATVSCTSNRTPRAVAPERDHTISVTNWTGKTELFMEHPPLIAGEKARFAIHLTRLSDFKPLTEGRVEVRLTRADGGSPETFSSDAPSRSGIFGVDVVPRQAGSYAMSVHVVARGLADSHPAGNAMVLASGQSPPEAAGSEEETIAFLKEQQWTLEFGTEVVKERALRESFMAPGEIMPRTGGQAEVTAPIAGRIVSAALPGIGAPVQKGQIVARVLPPTERPADLASLERERSESATALGLAKSNRERVERLLNAGAIPVRRLEEARAAEATAGARVLAAERLHSQWEQSRQADATTDASRAFIVRSPISGVVAEASAVPGANVAAGERLFRIVDVSRVLVAANVPEAQLPRLNTLSGAELEIPDSGQRIGISRALSVGRIVDPQSRTVRVLYELSNTVARLAVGQAVSLRLFTSAELKAPAVPESAIVDDGGRPIVFVQLEGESFARKPVKLGSRGGGYVQVVDGVKSGERVVSQGANLVRLASLSTQVPAHGHVH